MKRRLLPLLLCLGLLCSLLPAASAKEEPAPVTALCVAEPGGYAFLDMQELQLLCRQATGHDLESVTFAALPASIGTLTCKGEKVTSETAYYQYRSPQISQISFAPYIYGSRRFTGQGELAFTMTDEKGKTVPGTLLLYVPEEDQDSPEIALGNRSTLAKAGEAVSLEDLFPFCTAHRDGSITYGEGKVTSLTFALPPSDQGSLWLSYDHSDARKVLPEEILFPDEAPNFYDVTFVPTHKEAGTVQLQYTVSLDTKKNLTDAMTLNFTEKKSPSRPRPSEPHSEPDPIRVSTISSPVGLSAPLYSACASLEIGSLETVIFDTLPTAGEGAILSNNTPVTAGEPYPYGSLTFVPGGSFREDITLRYLGADNIGFTFSGALTLSYGYLSDLRFQDLTGWEWAMPAVRFLEENYYGYGGSYFRPGDCATRMDLIHALVEVAYDQGRGWGLPAPPFTDLPEDKILSEAVAVAVKYGLVLGDGEGRLLPDAQITRQDALVIVNRAFADRRKLPSIAGDLSAFSDADSLAPYAREAAANLYARDILQGDGSGRLDPLSPITRAEMACLLYRAFG